MGDDGSTGTATTYDLRYSTSPITAGNFASATQVTGEPAPKAAGQAESIHRHGPRRGHDLLLRPEGRRTRSRTGADLQRAERDDPTSSGRTTPPAAVTNLAVGTRTQTSLLTWTAVGDDGSTGTATTYDLRYSTSPITAANFGSATPVTGEPAPKTAGQAETLTVTGLDP